MFPLIKKFFTDETAFIRMVRGFVMIIGGLISAGYAPEFLPPAVGIALSGLAVMFSAGEKNKDPQS